MMTNKALEMIQQANNVKDRPAMIDSLLKQLRNEMNELSEQGNDITKKMWNVYSSIDCLMVDQKKNNSSDSSNSDSSSTNNSSLESNSSKENTEKINDNLEKNSISANNKYNFFNDDSQIKNSKDDLKQLPALESLYASVTKNLNVAYENLRVNEAHVLNDYSFPIRNNLTNKIYPQNNYNNSNSRKNRLNIKLNNRRTALNSRTSSNNNSNKTNENINEECYKNCKPLIINSHNNLGLINNGTRNSPNQYLSDADSTVSYEAIDNLGSNSIDSGYKSCCQTPDFYSTNNLIDRKTSGRLSFDASVRSSSSNSFNHNCISFDQSSNLDEKIFKHYQGLLANNSLASVYASLHLRNSKKNNLIKDENVFKKNFFENESKKKDLNLEVTNNNFTFKSALALKKLNENNLSKKLKNRSLSQSEQNLDNWNSNNLYSQLKKKPKNLVLNKSNLSLDGNDFYYNNYSNKEFTSSKENFIFDQNFSHINDNYLAPKYKIIKRKLPQINYSTKNLLNTPDMIHNEILSFKNLHSSDLKLNYSEEQKFKLSYPLDKKLVNRFSVSNEQIFKTENIYSEIDRCSLYSYNDEEEILLNNYDDNFKSSYHGSKKKFDEQLSLKKSCVLQNNELKKMNNLKNLKKTKKALSTNTMNEYDFSEKNYSECFLKKGFTPNNLSYKHQNQNNLLNLINQTKSNDDLNIYNKNKFKNEKRKTFKLTSPLRSITKALTSETNDFMKIKEIAKNKIVNLIDNLTSTSSNNKKISSKNNWQNKYFFNKSPNKNQNKKTTKSLEIDKILDEMTKLYFSQRQKTTHFDSLPDEHIYEELKASFNETTKEKNDIRSLKTKNLKINLDNVKEFKKDEKKNSLIDTTYFSENENLSINFSDSLNSDCEEEIKRKINSDEIITKIENVINNIDTMLSNKENLNLEYKNFYN